MKRLLGLSVLLVAGILSPPAEAHLYSTAWDCYAAHMPCEGTLTAGEATTFEAMEYAQHHPWGFPAGTRIWAYHRINSSAMWVDHYLPNLYAADQCLVDIDKISGTAYFRYHIDCTYWGAGPKS